MSAKVISINNVKGGANKTGTAIELAACLGQKGKKVLLVDLDQQQNLSDYVGCDFSKPNIVDMIEGEKQFDLNELIQKKNLFDVICGSAELSMADRRYTGMDDPYLLSDALDMIKENYDYIILDNSPSRNIIVTMSYVASDYIVIPTEADDGSIKGVNSVISDVQSLRNSRNHLSHAKILALILNRYENSNQHKDAIEILKEISDRIGDKPVVAIVRKAVVMSEVKTYRTTVQEKAHQSNIAVDFRNLTEQVLKRIESEV